MQTRHTNALVYLLLLAAAPSRALPAALPASNDTVDASTNPIQMNSSQITVSPAILDNTTSTNDTDIDKMTQVQILDTINNNTVDELAPSSSILRPGDISIKKGGGGAGTRGSGSSSGGGSGSTGSSNTGSGTAGSGGSTEEWPLFYYLWFPSTLFTSSATTVDTFTVMTRAVALAVATTLATSWIF
ncbi:hypothetical protein O1611_g2349 [Lasiodiplodia mahajangana]|uniref:Uncharacterized protein n=1 Tax=Lasiodiplodia mahajangana TaxID=1108764 RepID=A0ACC2JV48_9PEZI|nr:hypothetical protein O1611_g2349 [Lasiodiplodia mahajangana]